MTRQIKSCPGSSVRKIPGCSARGWEFSFPPCIPEEPARVGLDKLYSLQMPKEEGNSKQLLSTLQLGNPEKRRCQSESTGEHTVVIR